MSGGDLLVLHVAEERPRAPRYQRLLDELNDAAVAAFAGAGWRPELVATEGAGRDDILARARAADAVVLMGGEDVDPRLYGGRLRYPGSGWHMPESDRTMIATVLQAVADRTPLLGICRGHQIINVALGGTLVEHLRGHVRRLGDTFVNSTLQIAEGEPAAFAVADARCSHHQAVRDVGEGLRVVARASDGTVEAIAHRDAPVVGVQWHPEHPDVAAAQLPALLGLVART